MRYKSQNESYAKNEGKVVRRQGMGNLWKGILSKKWFIAKCYIVFKMKRSVTYVSSQNYFTLAQLLYKSFSIFYSETEVETP